MTITSPRTRSKRRHDRHVLAVVGVEIDHAGHVGPGGVLGLEQLDRAVRAAVVGEDDLVAAAQGIEHRIEPREEEREIELLVVDRNDDREVDGVAHRMKASGEWRARAATTRVTSARVIAGKSGRVRMIAAGFFGVREVAGLPAEAAVEGEEVDRRVVDAGADAQLAQRVHDRRAAAGDAAGGQHHLEHVPVALRRSPAREAAGPAI